jgi:hypothetical protein
MLYKGPKLDSKYVRQVAAVVIAAATLPILVFSDRVIAGGKDMDIEQVLERHSQRLMQLPEVTGCGVGERVGKPVIVVMIKTLTPEVKDSLPKSLDGHPVVVEVSGEVSAF